MYHNLCNIIYKRTFSVNNNILGIGLAKNYCHYSPPINCIFVKPPPVKTKPPSFTHYRLPLFFSTQVNNFENSVVLNKEKAQTLILRMTDEERTILFQALREFESEKTKLEYEGTYIQQ